MINNPMLPLGILWSKWITGASGIAVTPSGGPGRYRCLQSELEIGNNQERNRGEERRDREKERDGERERERDTHAARTEK